MAHSPAIIKLKMGQKRRALSWENGIEVLTIDENEDTVTELSILESFEPEMKNNTNFHSIIKFSTSKAVNSIEQEIKRVIRNKDNQLSQLKHALGEKDKLIGESTLLKQRYLELEIKICNLETTITNLKDSMKEVTDERDKHSEALKQMNKYHGKLKQINIELETKVDDLEATKGRLMEITDKQDKVKVGIKIIPSSQGIHHLYYYMLGSNQCERC